MYIDEATHHTCLVSSTPSVNPHTHLYSNPRAGAVRDGRIRRLGRHGSVRPIRHGRAHLQRAGRLCDEAAAGPRASASARASTDAAEPAAAAAAQPAAYVPSPPG